MYSLMSMRTMACSSSNRNSASARAVSVFPTPVGPRKINDPIGRRGSLNPARERRIALATTVSAASWPMTLSRRRCSISTSFFTSPSSIRATGIPVHLLTILAMSSSSTSSLSIRATPEFPSCTAFSFLSSASSLGSSPYWICAARSSWPLRVWSSASKRSASIRFFNSLMRLMASLSLVQRARSAVICSRSVATSRSTASIRSRLLGSVSRFNAARSISSDVAARSNWSTSVGTEPI